MSQGYLKQFDLSPNILTRESDPKKIQINLWIIGRFLTFDYQFSTIQALIHLGHFNSSLYEESDENRMRIGRESDGSRTGIGRESDKNRTNLKKTESK